MKTISLLSAILFWSAISVSAQDAGERKVRFDMQIAQSFCINEWSSVKFASDRLPRASSFTDLRSTFNLYIIKRVAGLFVDMGVGIMPEPRNGLSDPAEQAAITMGVPYYTKEIMIEDGSRTASAHFKMTFGLFGRLSIAEKLSISPCFGIGVMSITAPTCKVVLKEHDSNMQYIARYQWFRQNEYSYSNDAALTFLAFRLRFAYPIAPKRNLLLGIECTLFMDRADFSESYTNYFNNNIVRTINHEGNRLNMTGFSVGFSF